MHDRALKCNTIQCLQCSKVQCSEFELNDLLCSAVHLSRVQCSSVQCNNVHFSLLLHLVPFFFPLEETHDSVPVQDGTEVKIDL